MWRRYTALHYASSNGHTGTMLALVEAGADVNCKTNDGYGAGRPCEPDARISFLGVFGEWSFQVDGTTGGMRACARAGKPR